MFDFDGIVIDTESPILQAWREVYEAHGQELTLEDWATCLGTIGGFKPLDHLETLLGHSIDDRDGAGRRRRERELELVATQSLRPGIESYLARAGELGLSIAIVSSSSTAWIESNLARVGRSEGWMHVGCANGDVTRAKPHPCLYEEALEALAVGAGEAVVFEDSPNGIAAAKAAGIFCVAVANRVTAGLDLGAADLRMESFEDMPLDDVLAAAEGAA